MECDLRQAESAISAGGRMVVGLGKREFRCLKIEVSVSPGRVAKNIGSLDLTKVTRRTQTSRSVAQHIYV